MLTEGTLGSGGPFPPANIPTPFLRSRVDVFFFSPPPADAAAAAVGFKFTSPPNSVPRSILVRVVADPFVVFENDDVLCVHKPAGASFHGDDLATRRPGVLARIRQLQASGTLRGSDYDGPLHSVHRLDKVTSGALLFAKVR